MKAARELAVMDKPDNLSNFRRTINGGQRYWRILLTSADENVLMRLGNELRETGHFVLLARNGIECLAQLRRGGIDLCVLDQDILWGGADGVLDACRIEQLHLPKLILLSNGPRQWLDRYGSTTVLHVPKPIYLDALVLWIGAVVCNLEFVCCGPHAH